MACSQSTKLPTFVTEAAKVWSAEERLEFFAWMASEPEADAVIKDSGADTIPGHILRMIRKEIEDGND